MTPPVIDRLRVQLDEEYRQQVRRRCQTDLLFLGRDVLGYRMLQERVHGPAAALCVQKDPDKPIEEQDPGRPKKGLQLDPRGTFKSTLSIVDSVQWIIGFPNVRICKLTATKPLATAIVGEITDHFVKETHAEPTLFQDLFPEFCISPRDKLVGTYTAPCRTRNWREATVMAFSIETSISGWHFDVLDPDDVVDTQNSSTPGGLAKVKKNYRINEKTLMPWGYINYKGTRYDPFDLWGDLLDKAKPGAIKTLIRSALTLKSGERLRPDNFPDPDECTLLFPELLPYEFLREKFEDDYSSFMTQYMNDAYGDKEVIFRKEDLLQATIPAAQIPVTGETFTAWRFAYQDHAWSGGCVGLMDGGRMYITDAVRGSSKPSALAHKVVHLAKKHGCHAVKIEETPGARYLEPAIQNYALALGWPLVIHWLEFQEDDGVRDQRMKGTEPLLAAGRLLFSDDVKQVNLKELHRQFSNYGMVEESELVDAVSRVAEALPKSIAVEQLSDQDALAWELTRQRDMHDKVHGLGLYAPREPMVEEKPFAVENSYGLDSMLGGLNG